MVSTEEQLARIGIAPRRREAVCWRVARVDAPNLGDAAARPAVEPPCSRALLYWSERLVRSPRRSPYRITRIASAGRPTGPTKP